jgi:uncharacterized membrane protein YozB (DUF420 family)
MVTYVESTISLGIQMVVLALLIGAIFLKSKNKYRQHGIVMFSAVVLHIVSILTVMLPSFGAYVGPGVINFSDVWAIITLFHVSTGLIAVLFGIWLVGSWHLKTDIKQCFRKKRVMDATLILWILSILLGILLYTVIVGSI